MDLPRFSAGADDADVATALATRGCVIIEHLAPPTLLEQARRELAPWMARTATGVDDFSGRHTRRTGALLTRSAACRDLVQQPLVLGGVGAVLARGTSFQLHLTQAIAIGPGEPAQMIHRDQWAFDFFPFPSGYEVTCNTIWALSDFTEANGATRLVPRSHLREDRLQFTAADTVAAEMPAGSVLLYTGALYHGAGANHSDAVRIGLNLTYALSWLRQEENQYLAVPAEQARSFPEPLLRLMGYARGAYALGYVDDLRDPLDVLLGRSGGAALGDLGAANARLRE